MATARKTAAAPKKVAGPGTTARKASARPAAKGTNAGAKAKAKATAPKAAKPAKADKPRKPKLVRDSFTIPKLEYAVIDALKERAARLGRPAKKSEVLRAGVMALQAMSDTAFLACVQGVPAIKTGRPAKS